ncbi:Zn-ribbon domain-containing OB-fold protein [Celeribacter indicus]|uniref:DUF35 domain-containing protein n=1 Tax=Celeribacter indicus TaxID=1208324 RepID=A0A0B5EAA8_9RHOB|nr:Zn-ribbon domain-containing OB-fold protein [Celeribacter indicus]AJE49212.1 hypothetical protein P73_4497 [Celeribacter indicus]SDX51723.1 hypothetical protein SAMN05443573_1368 [Celeribacter indicus]
MTGSLENGDSVAYWEGARDGRLMFQKCGACGTVQFPPRFHCASCWEETPEWIESTGRGRVESFTVVRRAPLPEFRDKVPYVVAAVRVEEGPRMITNLVGEDALGVRIGDEVRVTFETNAQGDTLPQFKRS